MKNIETIITEAGIELTDEQKKAINAAVAENYKPVSDWQKQVDKVKVAEQKAQDAENALKEFDGVDVEGFKNTIKEWQKKAEDAEKNAEAQILKRDQEDWLKGKFTELGVKSQRTVKALIADIMDDKDGLPWKDGAYLGFDDYIKAENEKDHFYDTEEEREAAERSPKFTDSDKGGSEGGKPFAVPLIW